MRKTSAVVAGVVLTVIGQPLAVSPAAHAESAQAWPQLVLPNPRDVEMGGVPGNALRRGVERMGVAPYTVAWVLADLSFEVKRRYTDFSGDVSGRFIELTAVTSPAGKKSPAILEPVLAAITNTQNARFQKPDGHFGVDVDLTAKGLAADSPTINLLWGNARLLVGLVACAREYNDPHTLAAAKRLGDFYVETSSQLCDPKRVAEYRSSGTWGHSYTCNYFPAIEGLAMLYGTTKDERYLKQAQQMAEFFLKFDMLPIDHSHGNLSAYRGIVQLYEITSDRKYLDRTRAKWDMVVKGGYVWPIGGIGERWDVFYRAGEGCSEADWLRCCLDLWRFTGEARYLHIADRLLYNQYPVTQCDNGGYGDLYFDGDPAAGPHAAVGALEADYCCCFAGPLALHFLKSYLAAGSERGIHVNFAFDFTAPVKASGCNWRVGVRTVSDGIKTDAKVDVTLEPQNGGAGDRKTTLWFRVPEWASGIKQASLGGKDITPVVENGYLRVDGNFSARQTLSLVLPVGLTLEGRRFQKIDTPKAGEITRFRDVSVFAGPQILCTTMPGSSSGRVNIIATVDATGRLRFPGQSPTEYITVALSNSYTQDYQLGGPIGSAPVISLHPWTQILPGRREVFAFDVIVVPPDMIPAATLGRLKETAPAARTQP